jgi:D-alanine-D-alanine ligase
MAPLTVGVLMGGISSEHPVSLVSGTGMLKNLDPERYRGFPILITKDNRWMWPRPDAALRTVSDAREAETLMASPPADWHLVRFPEFSVFPRCDLMLIGLHGVGGEDGRLQGFLDLAGQPYTGSGALGSALAMDKIAAKEIYRAVGIPTGRFRVVDRSEYSADGGAAAVRASLESEFGYPVVLKTPTGGSSIGMGIARDASALESLIESLGPTADRLLAEEFLAGREGTCGYLAGFPPLAPTEIRPVSDRFFSFEAKYKAGGSEEITPATFPAEIIAEMQRLAAMAHDALRLSVYSRTDFIYAEGGDRPGVYALETNNLPGFTPTSLLPQAAAHAGLGYRELLGHIIGESLKK